MLIFPGYKELKLIYESLNSLVYRGTRELDQTPVILKVLKENYPTQAELTRYKLEYEITHSLNLTGVVKAYEFKIYKNTLVIVLEDFGGESLKILMQSHVFSLEEILRIAIQVTTILEKIHAANVIHKDINPSNIVLNLETGEVKLIDFGIASIFTQENTTLKNPNCLEGTLAYISPEQTGRMNRSLDYRTDFYSLGVTLYELLTHKLPFETNDAIELIHCHLAKKPVPPRGVLLKIPQEVSDIVMKLLSKNIEERYQTAYGIKSDLETCLQQLKTTGKIDSFSLGNQDVSERFEIPQKLYGRASEIAILLTTFERVSQGSCELMLVAGYSGIGKSSLVQELYKPITQKRGHFITGKFDQFQRNIPYSAVVSAFQSLVRHLLSESAAKLKSWQEKIKAAIGTNGQVIIDVIPEIELILGKQPPVPELIPSEAQNRFNAVFQNFIRVFCSAENPLVIFLDDLQWADSASLKLIELMMADTETHYLFLIAAYRDNEVSPTHPWMITLDVLQAAGAIIHQIILIPLQFSEVNQLIADTLHKAPEFVQPLSELVFTKTRGNPFFTNQFLKTLYQENLLKFVFSEAGGKGEWQWNLSEIEPLGITDNVVELMIGKLKKLPHGTQAVLRYGACIGNHFDLKTLSIIQEKPVGDLFSELLPAIHEGLILPTSELQVTEQATIVDSPLLILNYKFLHDRVQQAAYALIDPSQKQAVHLKIGRLLLKNLSSPERETQIFTLIDHLNMGRTLIRDEAEVIELIRLNLEAAKKAKDAMAYAAAKDYLTVGTEVLPDSAWQDYYELTLILYIERASIEYLNGNFETSESLIYQAVNQAKTPLEKAEIFHILIVQYTLRAKYAEAIQTARTALALIGINLPESNLQEARDAEIAAIEKNIGNRSILSLIELPEMQSREHRIAMKLLTSMGPPTYRSHQRLWAVIVAKQVNFCIQQGQISSATYSYTSYGGLMGYVLNDYQAGYEFGELALAVSERFDNPSDKSVAYLMVGSSLRHWSKHLKYASEDYNKAYQVGLESGNLQYSAYAFGHNMYCRFYQGKNLDELLEEISGYLLFSTKRKNQWAIDLLLGGHLIVQNLRKVTPNPLEFQYHHLTEGQYLQDCQTHHNLQVVCIYKILKTFVLYLYGQWREALQCYNEAEALIVSVATQGLLPSAEHLYNHSLILAALYAEASEADQQHYWQQLEAHQIQLKIWADHCPENFQHKYLLLAAEMAQILGQEMKALDLYDQAIEAAQQSQFIQQEALCCERAAHFWLKKGKEEIALLYLRKAHYAYRIWGASRKVKDLEIQYPDLGATAGLGLPSTVTIDTRSTTSRFQTNRAPIVDLASIIKASQALSSEIVLEKLLEKLINITLENAGAQLGYLILERDGKLAIDAIAITEQDQPFIRQSIPIETSEKLPLSVINYVVKTHEDIILNNAAVGSLFDTDAYIKTYKPKSLLCSPILSKGKLIGILYLENNLMAGAFTRDRLEILKLLTAQAAISLENANLYQQSQEYSQQLEQYLHNLQAAQLQLVQSEKMSSLGQLIAGVAHEINNPVGFISGNLIHIEEYIHNLLYLLLLYQQYYPEPASEIANLMETIELDYLREDLPSMIASMKVGVERIANISISLRTFSRADTTEKVAFDIHTGLDSTLLILKHRLKANEHRSAIQIIRQYGELPLVECYPGQLNQVFMNLLANAIDALNEASIRETISHKSKRYTITIRTELTVDNYANITIADNGLGMAEEVRQQVFDHLFTTKPVGQGTGLGLSISRQIVEDKHLGKLMCTSAPGEGAEFMIKIPICC